MSTALAASCIAPRQRWTQPAARNPWRRRHETHPSDDGGRIGVLRLGAVIAAPVHDALAQTSVKQVRAKKAKAQRQLPAARAPAQQAAPAAQARTPAFDPATRDGGGGGGY
jgi:hypothetical protein